MPPHCRRYPERQQEPRCQAIRRSEHLDAMRTSMSPSRLNVSNVELECFGIRFGFGQNHRCRPLLVVSTVLFNTSADRFLPYSPCGRTSRTPGQRTAAARRSVGGPRRLSSEVPRCGPGGRTCGEPLYWLTFGGSAQPRPPGGLASVAPMVLEGEPAVSRCIG